MLIRTMNAAPSRSTTEPPQALRALVVDDHPIVIVALATALVAMRVFHTIDAAHTIQRIVDSYSADQQGPMRIAIANILRGVIAQKLIPTLDGKGRVPCSELLIITPYIRQLITDNKLPDVFSAMARGHSDGMMTFDQDLLRLCKENLISKEAALFETSRPDNFLSMLQGISVKL